MSKAMKKTISGFLLFVFFLTCSFGHPFKPRHFVLIDTDGGIDDMRAICMLLASHDTRVLGITVTSGVLSSGNAYVKVRSLLNTLRHEGIPVGITPSGIRGLDHEPAWKAVWGDEGSVNLSDAIPGQELIQWIFDHTSDPITFVCLGSLSAAETYHGLLPDFTRRIKTVLWSTGQINPPAGFNHELSPGSFDHLIQSGVPVEAVSGGSFPGNGYDKTMRSMIENLPSPYAKAFMNGFRIESPYRFRWFDEMVPVYLHYPGIFTTDTLGTVLFHSLADFSSFASLPGAFRAILNNETEVTNQVLKSIPAGPSAYMPDVQPMVTETIRKYGKDEWDAGVLANELHRHLGVYAIIGVKMGIRALEYFGAGIDELSIVSHAGLVPPYSCMIDGLQVSTGATLGHGLISVASGNPPEPVADFTYMGRTIRLSLEKETAKKIASEIRELNLIHGLDSEIYWELVRILAIKYWAQLDRHVVFEISQL